MLKTTGSRLFAALLGYLTLVILLLTLNPFYMRLPRHITIKYESSLPNLLINILLFLPLGFLYRMSTGRKNAFLLGACLSIVIEILQLFIPARATSIVDVLANAAGAGIGAFLYERISPGIQVSSSLVSRFRLETPLMGLTYLLVPLLWVNTLALHETTHRWLLTLLLGICGAILFSAIFSHWWNAISAKAIVSASLVTGAWYIVGTGPKLMSSPPLMVSGLAVMVLTGILTTIPHPSQERRFERITLQRLAPVFALYLVLLAVWFPAGPWGPWHGFFGFTDRLKEGSLRYLYSRIEFLIAFTILGYLIAEWRGRLELSLSQDLPQLFLIGITIAATLEIVSGFQAERGASLVRFLMALLGAGFGGVIYHLSRAHIRYLLGR